MKKRLLQLSIFLFLSTTSHAYYQAEQGRWLNRDPIGEERGQPVKLRIEEKTSTEPSPRRGVL